MLIATLHPNHTWEKVVFGTWRYERWDASDTVLVADPRTDAQVGGHFRPTPAMRSTSPTWYAGGAMGAEHSGRGSGAGDGTEGGPFHAGTPGIVHLDSLGRPLLTISHNRFKYGTSPAADPPVEEFLSTRLEARHPGRSAGHGRADARDRVVVRNTFDLLGNRVHQASMEAGERRTLNDAAGKSLRTWDSRNHQFRTAYDPLRRPTDLLSVKAQVPELVRWGAPSMAKRAPTRRPANLRGRVVQLFDQAGVVTSDDYDFKGNLLSSQRQLAQEYKASLDWSPP